MNRSTVLCGLAFHCHHDRLAEWCWDYEGRLEYIQTEKPEEERELRKALFQLIPIELLPAAFVEAADAFGAAFASQISVRKVDKARVAFNKILAAVNLDALHRQICHPNCPWNGKTIFSRGKSIEALAGGKL